MPIYSSPSPVAHQTYDPTTGVVAQLGASLTRWEGGEEDQLLQQMVDAEQAYNAGIKECQVHFPNEKHHIPKITRVGNGQLYETVD